MTLVLFLLVAIPTVIILWGGFALFSAVLSRMDEEHYRD